ncbi:MAG: dynamin family protein [Selenomonadaceae bacterium]|nr:dynamin family protein [Selenomonadaceae bacterium]
MTKVYVKYNPYRLQTIIKINGQPIETDNTLYRHVKGKRLQEWVGTFPEALKHAANDVSFDVTFYGLAMDYEDFEFAFKEAVDKGVIKSVNLEFEEGRAPEDITNKIVNIFNDLQTGPIPAFKDPKLINAFENIRKSVFPINVIATMSSGKSTLINALLSCELMPSKNQACTATITEITDNDQDVFNAIVYDKNGDAVETVDRLTYEDMDRLNSDDNVHRIAVDGDIPFIDAKDIALSLVDTPGPNNSQNQAHKDTTYSAIKNGENNLILYVLNGTQLGINDDAQLLDYVAKQIKEGGKQVRDRFLFVVNKMDGFDPAKEDIGEAILAAKNYLTRHGIEDPQIFPCSAFTALNIRTHLKGLDIGHMSMDEIDELPDAATETWSKMRKFNKFESMHLENYSVLSPSARKEIEYRLNQAIEAKDTKEQALIHCGILSIEAAIIAYVKKYAKTRKIRDLVDSFQEVLESSQVLANAKISVAENEESAQACIEREKAIRAKIEDGEEAKKFKERIMAFNPIPKIQAKAESLKNNAIVESSSVFNYYDDVIDDKKTARRMLKQFSDASQNCMAEVSAELENVVNNELVNTGETLLQEYQEKLLDFDNTVANQDLDFNTIDLVKDALQNMRNSIDEWRTDAFVEEKIEEIGKTTTEEETIYKKVGEEKHKVLDHIEKREVGKENVKVGQRDVYAGTRKVKNPEKSWWQVWKSSYIEEDVYVTEDIYEERAVYKDEEVYRTEKRDVFEERTRTIEKYEAEKDKLQAYTVDKYRMTLDAGIENSLKAAERQIESLKKQFLQSFDELDEIVKNKYSELNACINDKDIKEQELARSQEILNWIEGNKREMEEVLDI